MVTPNKQGLAEELAKDLRCRMAKARAVSYENIKTWFVKNGLFFDGVDHAVLKGQNNDCKNV